MKLVKQISFTQHLLKQNRQQRYILRIKYKLYNTIHTRQNITQFSPLHLFHIYPDPQLAIAHRPQLFTKQTCNLKHYKQRERERHQYHCKQMTDLDGARDGDRVEALSLDRSLATAQAATWIFQELVICALFFLNKKMDITHLRIC